jgi:iron complex transport system substrate-binding protein
MWRVLLGALMLCSAAPVAAEAPRRIVSLNLCADQLLVALADPATIRGVTRFAADPSQSVLGEAARTLPVVAGGAEAVLSLAPDLVLAGPIDRQATQALIAAHGVKVEVVELVTSLEAGIAQVRRLARRLGREPAGERLVAEIEAAAVALGRPAPRRTLMLERRGYAAGPDSLAADLLARAGFVPVAGAPSGLGGFVSLEGLIALAPEVLATPGGMTPEDQGAALLSHPALMRLYPPARRLTLPERFITCGGPAIVAALHHLAAERARMGP